MANEKIQFLTPLGRLVGGSVSKMQDKDSDGKPYVIKTGPKAGQPSPKAYVALAIPKGAEAHWAATEWGAKVWQVGHTAFPGIAQNPTFAWKIEDGDSTIPNTKGKKPSDRIGYKGNWIMHLSTSIPIKACNANGDTQIDPTTIKTGYFVQVAVMCQGNSSSQKPGVYLNPVAVALSYVGEEISQGLDTATVGFGGQAMPAGASALPNVLTGAGTPPAVPTTGIAFPTAGATVAPPVPGVHTPPAVPGVPAPNAAILAPPVPGVVAAPPAPPAAPVGPQMTAKAAGQTYAAFIAAGWNDQALRANGYMI
jgi:hypothetical protein